jgi:hypothetical protein
MSNTTSSVIVALESVAGDNKPLVLGAVAVGLGGLAVLVMAFKQFAPSWVTNSSLFKKVASGVSTAAAEVKEDVKQTAEKVLKDPSSALETLKEGISTSLNDVTLDVVSNVASIQIDPAHLADVQAVLALMGKPHILTTLPLPSSPVEAVPTVPGSV